jgi:hypothetical protein
MSCQVCIFAGTETTAFRSSASSVGMWDFAWVHVLVCTCECRAPAASEFEDRERTQDPVRLITAHTTDARASAAEKVVAPSATAKVVAPSATGKVVA